MCVFIPSNRNFVIPIMMDNHYFHQLMQMNVDDNHIAEAEEVPPQILPKENQLGIVSILNRCETTIAKWLYIYNLSTQKELAERHDIGGTYTNGTPELWFYYTTSMRPKSFILLNLFVCHRKTGSFSIGVPNSNQFTMKENVCTLSNTLTWHNFRSTQNDETHYIKTFHFPIEHFKTDIEADTTMLIIPLNIQLEPPFSLNSDVLKTIKLEHNESSSLIQQEKTDFIIKSDSGREYPVHKVLVASHSPVLRQLMKDNNMLILDINDNTVEILLQYIYTGTIKKIGDHDVLDLLETVHKFQLKPLLILIDHLIEKDLTVNNAVQMAIVAKKYELSDLKNKVFDYIKNNPGVMNSEGWKNLNDVELTKSIFQYVLTNKI